MEFLEPPEETENEDDEDTNLDWNHLSNCKNLLLQKRNNLISMYFN